MSVIAGVEPAEEPALLAQGDLLARDLQGSWGSTRGGTVGQGDPITRDPLKCMGARALHGRALGDPMHPGVGELQLRSPGGTVGQGDPLARDPQRSLVKGVCQGDPIAAPPFSPPVSGCRGDPLADAGGVVELRISVIPAIILAITCDTPATITFILILLAIPCAFIRPIASAIPAIILAITRDVSAMASII